MSHGMEEVAMPQSATDISAYHLSHLSIFDHEIHSCRRLPFMSNISILQERRNFYMHPRWFLISSQMQGNIQRCKLQFYFY
ncbi:hypothetical protein XENTR_v10018303 [Xenopus tropicalis]|nr:hypothetical protein XENTR_v10018303 [Xenopus tropicalis]